MHILSHAMPHSQIELDSLLAALMTALLPLVACLLCNSVPRSLLKHLLGCSPDISVTPVMCQPDQGAASIGRYAGPRPVTPYLSQGAQYMEGCHALLLSGGGVLQDLDQQGQRCICYWLRKSVGGGQMLQAVEGAFPGIERHRPVCILQEADQGRQGCMCNGAPQASREREV